MKRAFAYPSAVAMGLLIASLIAVFAANFGSDAIEGIHVGLLALGVPKIDKGKTCDLCIPTRDHASDYAPIEHFMGGPKRIILMRHADKTDDRDDEDLSGAGVERAKHLVTYIPETFGKPDVIIASAPSKHTDRPTETVEPLADALGIKVRNDFAKDEFADLIDDVLNDPDYKNKTVVICWHHKELPAMAALLGAPADSYPDPWPDDAYNLILDFQYDAFSGNAPKVTRVTEPF
jgi:phosphohistidine phosphatase SixA